MDQAEIVRILTADYPPPIWYVPSIVLAILAFASIVDARTGRVPDLPVALGFGGAIGALAWYTDWFTAGEQAAYAILAVLGLRLFNRIYEKLFHHDAFGFGDAKWTGLAVAAFGLEPVFWAWIVGAWLGLIWMGVLKLRDKVSDTFNGHVYVHFAPFLFIGLVLSLFRKEILTNLISF